MQKIVDLAIEISRESSDITNHNIPPLRLV